MWLRLSNANIAIGLKIWIHYLKSNFPKFFLITASSCWYQSKQDILLEDFIASDPRQRMLKMLELYLIQLFVRLYLFFFWLSSELGLAISFLRKMLHSPKWWLRICSITAKLFWKKELFRSFRPIDGRLKPSHPFLIGSLLGISSKSHIQKYCIFQLEWLRSNTSRTSKAWEILNNFFALVLSCKIFRFGLEELKCPLWKLQLSR